MISSQKSYQNIKNKSYSPGTVLTFHKKKNGKKMTLRNSKEKGTEGYQENIYISRYWPNGMGGGGVVGWEKGGIKSNQIC